MTKLELILTYSNIAFFVFWFLSVWAFRQQFKLGDKKESLITKNLIAKIDHLHDDALLAKAMIESSKNQLEAQQEMINSLKILMDRIAEYNERLNALTDRVNHNTSVILAQTDTKPSVLKN